MISADTFYKHKRARVSHLYGVCYTHIILRFRFRLDLNGRCVLLLMKFSIFFIYYGVLHVIMSQGTVQVDTGDSTSPEIVPNENSPDDISMFIEDDLSPRTKDNGGDNGGGVVFTHPDKGKESTWTKVAHDRKRQRISTGGSSSIDCPSKMSVQDYQKLSVDDKLSALFTELSGIGAKVDKCLNLNSKVQRLENQIDDHQSRLTFLEYKALDLEARSRRNNLIFSGLPESRDENCLLTISNFLKSHMEIDPCPDIPRVHRLGRFQRDKTRPIIAYFLDYRATEHVISKANKLKGTQFSINRDYPKEIVDARKSLWPEYKALRRDFPQSKVSLVYPAKIIKDGKVHADMFPKWNPILHGHRSTFDNHVLPIHRTQACDADVRIERDTQSYGHVTQSSRDSNRSSSRSASANPFIHRSRSNSRSPRRSTNARGRAPSRRRPWTVNTPSNASGADPQFSRPWDDVNASSPGSRAGSGHH